MKTTLDWFKHDATASESPKFITLRASPYGWAGEGRFWALNGLIARSDNARLDLGRKFAKAAMADKLDMTADELEEFLVFLRDECELVEYQSGLVWTERVLEDLSEVMVGRQRDAERKMGKRSIPAGSHPETDSFHPENGKIPREKTRESDSESDKDKEHNGSVRPSAQRPAVAELKPETKAKMAKIFTAAFPGVRVETDDALAEEF